MSNFRHLLTVSPLVYYPNQTDRAIQRIAMYDNDTEVAFVDLYVKDDWARFLFVWVHPDYRDEQTIWYYIENAFKIELGVTKIYWFGIVPALTHFLYKIAEARPDLTFAATGASNLVLNN